MTKVEGHCLLIINPGSTSTKVALYDGENLLHEENLLHNTQELEKYDSINDQLDFRTDTIKDYLARHRVKLTDLSGIASRGGVIGSLEPGAYMIDEAFANASFHSPTPHPANLAPVISYKLAQEAGVNAYAYDLVCGCGTPDALYTVSGVPELPRPFLAHVLNSRAVCFEQARRTGVHITDATYIVTHMGGGVTTNLVDKGVIRDIVADDEGTLSPERSGGVPCRALVKLCFSGKYTERQVQQMLKGKGGFSAYLGTNDLREVEARMNAGDKTAGLLFDAMALQIAKDIASLSVVVCGRVDCIILTGGMAHSERLTAAIRQRVVHIAEVCVIPGTFEMEALAKGVTRVIRGEERANLYEIRT